ncbi:MAG: hypothetical protein LBN92_00835 [Treponema sp.]|jgi:uncharacterized membrane protein|nr:hypothetical protein [Treponema sp.]
MCPIPRESGSNENGAEGGMTAETPLRDRGPGVSSPSGNRLLHYIVVAILILYPAVIFCSLIIFKMPPRNLSLAVIFFAAVYVLFSYRHYHGKNRWMVFLCPLFLCGIGLASFLGNSPLVFKLYPALADLAYSVIFGMSLFIPPPIVYQIEILAAQDIKKILSEARLLSLSRTMTIIWCVFFIIDGIISVITTFAGSDTAWGIYNAGVSYATMGLIFAAQFLYYKFVVRKEKRDRKQKPDR